MKKFIVYGAGDFADIVTNLIEDVLKREVISYVVNDDIYAFNNHNGKPVVKLDDVVNLYPPNDYSAVIGFIGNDMRTSREKAFEAFFEMGYDLENLIHPTAAVSSAKLGKGNIILANSFIAFNSSIGNGNIVWQLAAIGYNNVIGSYNNISPHVSTSGNVTVGNHCFLGNNSTYKNKVIVSDYTLVGANAYISHDTLPYGVYVPQKSICLESKKSTDFNL